MNQENLRNFFTDRHNIQFFVVMILLFIVSAVFVNVTSNQELVEDNKRDFANDTDELVEVYDDMTSDVENGVEDLAEDLPDSDIQAYLADALEDDLGEFANRIAFISTDDELTLVNAEGTSDDFAVPDEIQTVREENDDMWWLSADNSTLYYAAPLETTADTVPVMLVTIPQSTLQTMFIETAQTEDFYVETETGYAVLLDAEAEVIATYGNIDPTTDQISQLLTRVEDNEPNEFDVYTFASTEFIDEESVLVSLETELEGWRVVGSIPTGEFPTVGFQESTENLFTFSEVGTLVSDNVEAGVDFLNTEVSWLFRSLRWPIEQVITTIEDGLLAAPWELVIIATAVVAWIVSGRQTAYIGAIGMFAIGLIGLWDRTMTTLAMLLTSMAFCVVVGIPVGILSARSDRLNGIVRSILDAMQTIHPFVYLVPIVVLFGIGKVPGTIATIIFALPPMVRLTNLGIRQVPEDVVEAARAFGSNDWQLLRDVQIPLALPSIMAGVNQTLMLSLSMVVIVALIAGGGLGEEIYRAIGRADTGRAVVAGVAVLLLAVVVDRVSQGQTGKKRTVE